MRLNEPMSRDLLTWSECLEMKGRWEGKEDKEEKEQSTKVTLSSL